MVATTTRDFPRVLVYINIRISFLCFSLCNDIFNYRDISCILFFNQSSIQFLLNIYSDSSQTALKYLKDTEVDLDNIFLMTDDFNIRDHLQDSSFSFQSSFKDILFNITDSFHLELSKPTEYFPTRYSNNYQDSNLVLDLVFLCPNSTEFNTHHIYPQSCSYYCQHFHHQETSSGIKVCSHQKEWRGGLIYCWSEKLHKESQDWFYC